MRHIKTLIPTRKVFTIELDETEIKGIAVLLRECRDNNIYFSTYSRVFSNLYIRKLTDEFQSVAFGK